MSLIPWKPFQDVRDFFDDEDWFFPVFSKRSAEPDMDVYETERDVVAEISVPDFDPKNIDILVQDGVLRVSGKEEEKKEDKKKGYWKKEIKRGSFERMVRVPVPVNGEKTDAVYESGVLKISMPKKKITEKNNEKIKIKIK